MYASYLWPLVGAGLAIGSIVGVGRYLHEDHHHRIPELVATEVSPQAVHGYVDDFDSETVSSPFD